MNTELSGTLDRPEKAEIALIATMVMPHIILARSKDGNDGSITKTIGRRLDQWLNGNFMDLFLEAKALQERLPKKSKERSRRIQRVRQIHDSRQNIKRHTMPIRRRKRWQPFHDLKNHCRWEDQDCS